MNATAIDDFASTLLDPARMPPPALRHRAGAGLQARLAVHRNNVCHSLAEVLAGHFEVLRTCVGEAFFREMALAFVRECPPRSPVLATYGAALADWISRYGPAASLPWLPGLARLEHLRLQVCHAADAAPLAPAALLPLLAQPERLLRARLRFVPGAALFGAPHAVVSVWAAHQHEEMAERDRALGALDITRPEWALVLRDASDAVLVLPLPEADAALVARLHAGMALGAAAGAGGALEPTLGLLLAHGAIEAVQPGDAEAGRP